MIRVFGQSGPDSAILKKLQKLFPGQAAAHPPPPAFAQEYRVDVSLGEFADHYTGNFVVIRNRDNEPLVYVTVLDEGE